MMRPLQLWLVSLWEESAGKVLFRCLIMCMCTKSNTFSTSDTVPVSILMGERISTHLQNSFLAMILIRE